MGMHNWPEYGFGLMLNQEESKGFREKYYEMNKKISTPWINEIGDYIDVTNDYEFRCFTGVGGAGIIDEGVIGLFFYADWQPGAFFTAYHNMEECVDEFQERLGKYLPENFNYEDHIGRFEATIWS